MSNESDSLPRKQAAAFTPIDSASYGQEIVAFNLPATMFCDSPGNMSDIDYQSSTARCFTAGLQFMLRIGSDHRRFTAEGTNTQYYLTVNGKKVPKMCFHWEVLFKCSIGTSYCTTLGVNFFEIIMTIEGAPNVRQSIQHLQTIRREFLEGYVQRIDAKNSGRDKPPSSIGVFDTTKADSDALFFLPSSWQYVKHMLLKSSNSADIQVKMRLVDHNSFAFKNSYSLWLVSKGYDSIHLGLLEDQRKLVDYASHPELYSYRVDSSVEHHEVNLNMLDDFMKTSDINQLKLEDLIDLGLINQNSSSGRASVVHAQSYLPGQSGNPKIPVCYEDLRVADNFAGLRVIMIRNGTEFPNLQTAALLQLGINANYVMKLWRSTAKDAVGEPAMIRSESSGTKRLSQSDVVSSLAESNNGDDSDPSDTDELMEDIPTEEEVNKQKSEKRTQEEFYKQTEELFTSAESAVSYGLNFPPSAYFSIICTPEMLFEMVIRLFYSTPAVLERGGCSQDPVTSPAEFVKPGSRFDLCSYASDAFSQVSDWSVPVTPVQSLESNYTGITAVVEGRLVDPFSIEALPEMEHTTEQTGNMSIIPMISQLVSNLNKRNKRKKKKQAPKPRSTRTSARSACITPSDVLSIEPGIREEELNNDGDHSASDDERDDQNHDNDVGEDDSEDDDDSDDDSEFGEERNLPSHSTNMISHSLAEISMPEKQLMFPLGAYNYGPFSAFSWKVLCSVNFPWKGRSTFARTADIAEHCHEIYGMLREFANDDEHPRMTLRESSGNRLYPLEHPNYSLFDIRRIDEEKTPILLRYNKKTQHLLQRLLFSHDSTRIPLRISDFQADCRNLEDGTSYTQQLTIPMRESTIIGVKILTNFQRVAMHLKDNAARMLRLQRILSPAVYSIVYRYWERYALGVFIHQYSHAEGCISEVTKSTEKFLLDNFGKPFLHELPISDPNIGTSGNAKIFTARSISSEMHYNTQELVHVTNSVINAFGEALTCGKKFGTGGSLNAHLILAGHGETGKTTLMLITLMLTGQMQCIKEITGHSEASQRLGMEILTDRLLYRDEGLSTSSKPGAKSSKDGTIIDRLKRELTNPTSSHAKSTPDKQGRFGTMATETQLTLNCAWAILCNDPQRSGFGDTAFLSRFRKLTLGMFGVSKYNISKSDAEFNRILLERLVKYYNSMFAYAFFIQKFFGTDVSPFSPSIDLGMVMWKITWEQLGTVYPWVLTKVRNNTHIYSTMRSETITAGIGKFSRVLEYRKRTGKASSDSRGFSFASVLEICRRHCFIDWDTCISIIGQETSYTIDFFLHRVLQRAAECFGFKLYAPLGNSAKEWNAKKQQNPITVAKDPSLRRYSDVYLSGENLPDPHVIYHERPSEGARTLKNTENRPRLINGQNPDIYPVRVIDEVRYADPNYLRIRWSPDELAERVSHDNQNDMKASAEVISAMLSDGVARSMRVKLLPFHPLPRITSKTQLKNSKIARACKASGLAYYSDLLDEPEEYVPEEKRWDATINTYACEPDPQGNYYTILPIVKFQRAPGRSKNQQEVFVLAQYLIGSPSVLIKSIYNHTVSAGKAIPKPIVLAAPHFLCNNLRQIYIQTTHPWKITSLESIRLEHALEIGSKSHRLLYWDPQRYFALRHYYQHGGDPAKEKEFIFEAITLHEPRNLLKLSQDELAEILARRPEKANEITEKLNQCKAVTADLGPFFAAQKRIFFKSGWNTPEQLSDLLRNLYDNGYGLPGTNNSYWRLRYQLRETLYIELLLLTGIYPFDESERVASEICSMQSVSDSDLGEFYQSCQGLETDHFAGDFTGEDSHEFSPRDSVPAVQVPVQEETCMVANGLDKPMPRNQRDEQATSLTRRSVPPPLTSRSFKEPGPERLLTGKRSRDAANMISALMHPKRLPTRRTPRELEN